MKLLIHLFVSALAIIITAYILPGAEISSITGALVLAVVLSVINVFIKPFVQLITLPITVLTLGLFSLVINALFVMLSAKLVPDFSISGFWTALWFSIILSLINALFSGFKDSE